MANKDFANFSARCSDLAEYPHHILNCIRRDRKAECAKRFLVLRTLIDTAKAGYSRYRDILNRRDVSKPCVIGPTVYDNAHHTSIEEADSFFCVGWCAVYVGWRDSVWGAISAEDILMRWDSFSANLLERAEDYDYPYFQPTQALIQRERSAVAQLPEGVLVSTTEPLTYPLTEQQFRELPDDERREFTLPKSPSEWKSTLRFKQSIATLTRRLKSGDIPAVRINSKSYRLRESVLDDYA